MRTSADLGADWFNATEFPEITFVGREFAKTTETTGKIVGDLTIAGVTKMTALDVVSTKKDKTLGTRAMSSDSARRPRSSEAISE
ncbi:YceI family protein [Rhizobium sp. CCGE 510]|uniref:YceI family protein n=1 Tax=Rhizobium sp. CCGE 510 TaxID=1132836 RepID=UPI00027B7DFC|nr:YceI family protein [Rhizobium sp. CCGE 510]EJT06458.1 Protein yceI precursor [Rhizobium sp. CCGE 510]